MQPRPQHDGSTVASAQLTVGVTGRESAAKSRRARLYHSFLIPEDGAVTVDWVVLTAALVGIGAVVIGTIGYGTKDVINATSSNIVAVNVGYESATP